MSPFFTKFSPFLLYIHLVVLFLFFFSFSFTEIDLVFLKFHLVGAINMADRIFIHLSLLFLQWIKKKNNLDIFIAEGTSEWLPLENEIHKSCTKSCTVSITKNGNEFLSTCNIKRQSCSLRQVMSCQTFIMIIESKKKKINNEQETLNLLNFKEYFLFNLLLLYFRYIQKKSRV